MKAGIEIAPERVAEMKKIMIEWLKNSDAGTFSQAFALVNISRSTGYRFLYEDAQFKIDMDKARNDANETGLDTVETALMAAIRSGNMAGIIWFLKCKGKSRDWIDKLQIAADVNNTQTVNVVHDATNEFRQILTAVANAKAGGRPLPLALDKPVATGPASANDEPAVEHLADNGGARMGQDANGG